MCGIIGVFNKKESKKLAKLGLSVIRYRGKDAENYYSEKGFTVGHCLHSIVGKAPQPIINKKNGILVSNCAIYNWKRLAKKYSLKPKNDSHLISILFEKFGIEKVKYILDELDGVYAFAYIEKDKVVLARDLIGVKPLWFCCSDEFMFASEKKALEKMGANNPVELNPRKILIYNMKNKKIEFVEREFFKIKPEIKLPKKEIINKLIVLIKDAIKKRVPERKFGLLFSGGIDSSIIAQLLKNMGLKFTCYTSIFEGENMKEAEDLKYSIMSAKLLDVPLKIVKIKEDQIEKYLKKIVPLIEDTNVTKVGVAITLYAACEAAKKDGCKVVFSGLGSEEIFGGYERHKKSANVNLECVSGLLKMYERDTYRDDVISMHSNLEIRLPFLDKELVSFSLKIPSKYKIHNGKEKLILREAAISLGLNREIAMRKKRAAQYGSNFHKGIKRLAKKSGFNTISSYLRNFYPKRNLKLGALVSSGKDSIYAMYVMEKQNYEIACMITIKSKNPESFMFHTPSVDMVKLQSKAIGIPLIEFETEGKKEEELKDLKNALKFAKEKYGIEGVITGALFSSYQRSRIEKIADSLGLKTFSPLWHMNQELEMREIIANGFKFIITKISSEGLDKNWLTRIITQKDVDKLVELNKKTGINVAFEGGEAETLVLDGPIFKKRIEIVKSKIKEESKYVAELIIEKARLVEKN